MRVMRKRFRVLLFAALVAAFAVPVGFALSLESAPRWRTARPAVSVPAASTAVAATVVMPGPAEIVTKGSIPDPLPNAAKLLLVGSILIGLAAAVRKAS
jgi:hypothetical protein